MSLKFRIEGATPEQLARASAAAQVVIDATGSTAEECARAAFKQERAWEGWAEGDPEPLVGDGELAEAWREAERAGVAASGAGGPDALLTSSMELLT